MIELWKASSTVQHYTTSMKRYHYKQECSNWNRTVIQQLLDDAILSKHTAPEYLDQFLRRYESHYSSTFAVSFHFHKKKHSN